MYSTFHITCNLFASLYLSVFHFSPPLSPPLSLSLSPSLSLSLSLCMFYPINFKPELKFHWVMSLTLARYTYHWNDRYKTTM